MRLGLCEALRQDIVEDERPGSCFGNLGKGDGAFHRSMQVKIAT